MERRNIEEVIHDYDLNSLKPFSDLMAEAQGIHDSRDPLEWNKRLKRLADMNGCRYTPYTPPKPPTKKARAA